MATIPGRARWARRAALAGAGTLLAGLAGVLTAPAASAGIEVTCPHDSLQAAIAAAPPGATIEVSGTCTGTFDITHDLTIQGQPATLNGGGAGPVVTVEAGVTAALDQLTIQHGAADFGGGILNDGTLTVTDSTVSKNTALAGGAGGGIFNDGTLTLADSTVSKNTTGTLAEGGGIANSGVVTLTDSRVSGNITGTGGQGGGISDHGGAFLIDSTVSGNTATGAVGGGIFDGAFLTDSTVSGNTPDNCSPDVPGCHG